MPGMPTFTRPVFCAAIIGIALLTAGTTAKVSAPMPLQANAQDVVPDTDEQRIDDLVIANHILFDQGVLDAYGHVRVRSVKNPTHYFLSRSQAPMLVTKADIMEF